MDDDSVKVAPRLLFETSWEVCNKIGGIYTVLSTKAKTLHDLYKDRVIFVGPDVWSESNPSPYFEEIPSLLQDWKDACGASLPYGITVRAGRWNVPGRPIVLLVGFEGLYAVKDAFYGEMWNLYGVDSLHAYGDYDEACAFSHAAGIVIESLCRFRGEESGVIAHFDEWTTGMGLLYVKSRMSQAATIFTTHATSIGRSICGNGKPLYDYLHGYDGDQMARELNMEAKHSLEKTAAHQADVFTTVSDVTAVECEQLLQRRPDVVTPNGFEKNFVPASNRFGAARRRARATLLEVARVLTGRDFDEDSMLITTSGRCEYRNKGLDLFLDSMTRLSELGPERDVIAFVMVPAWCREARQDLRSRLESLPSTPAARRRVIGEMSSLETPCMTHTVNNPDSDAILCRMRQLGMDRVSETGKVTTIYVPCYLNGTDGIFNKTYYDLLIGMDATVFASYYEPWGYTPLESIAFGVPTVCTSLSGFGQWILATTDNTPDTCGVDVISRNDSNYEAVKDSIARTLRFLSSCDQESRAEISKAATATADRAAWTYFMEYYVEAYGQALAKAATRQ